MMEKGKLAGAAGLAFYTAILLTNDAAVRADVFDPGELDPAAAKMALAFASSVAYLIADEKIAAVEYVVGPSYVTTLYVKPKW